MDFLEACEALYAGKKIRCPDWDEHDYINIIGNEILDEDGVDWTRTFVGTYDDDEEWEVYEEFEVRVDDNDAITVNQNGEPVSVFADKEEFERYVDNLKNYWRNYDFY